MNGKGLFEGLFGNPIIAMMLFALIVAAVGGFVRSVRATIKQSKTKSTLTPLMVAVREGDYERVVQLAGDGQGLDATTALGDTALMFAAQKGRLDMVTFLIGKGANLNAQGDHKKTALIRAIENGSADVTRALVEHGADVVLADSDGSTPLDFAAIDGHKEIFDLLLARGATVNARTLLTAATNDRTELVRISVELGADINVNANSHGMTPLHLAIENQNVELVRFLVEHGADVNARWYKSSLPGDFLTPFIFAKVRKDKTILRIIEEAGGRR